VTRVLVLCTHNSARSQMAEGWLRRHAADHGLALDVHSAGTERTFVKPDAIAAMAEAGIDLTSHTSKRLDEVADPWAFDVVLTVCDSANEACPVYPTRTTRLHVAFPDPSGQPLERWRAVRDAIGAAMARLVDALAAGRTPTEAEVAGAPAGTAAHP
jgi:arsenate reductase